MKAEDIQKQHFTLDYLKEQAGKTANPTFGELLRFAREAIGMSQRALAELLEVSAPYLSDVERDRRAPLTQARTFKAARRLGISLLAEAKARATSTGVFTLAVQVNSPTTMTAGGILSLAWPWLNSDELCQIEEIALGALVRQRINPSGPPQ